MVKNFGELHKLIKTKNTKDIIEFYYLWKTTSHYRAWKRTYIPRSDEEIYGKQSWSDEDVIVDDWER